MVEVTLGWSTYTCWKRRSRAGSFSMYLRYSSRVVAPMHRSSPRPSMGFNRLPIPEDNCLVSSRSHRRGGTISQSNPAATHRTMGNDRKQSGAQCISNGGCVGRACCCSSPDVSHVSHVYKLPFLCQSKAQVERGGIRVQSRSGLRTLRCACQKRDMKTQAKCGNSLVCYPCMPG